MTYRTLFVRLNSSIKTANTYISYTTLSTVHIYCSTGYLHYLCAEVLHYCWGADFHIALDFAINVTWCLPANSSAAAASESLPVCSFCSLLFIHKLQYYKLRKFQDFLGPRNSDSRTFKHQPCFQVLSRPWIWRGKVQVLSRMRENTVICSRLFSVLFCFFSLFQVSWILLVFITNLEK